MEQLSISAHRPDGTVLGKGNFHKYLIRVEGNTAVEVRQALNTFRPLAQQPVIELEVGRKPFPHWCEQLATICARVADCEVYRFERIRWVAGQEPLPLPLPLRT